MNKELMEIQRGVASLKKDVEQLRRLKSDCDEAKKLLKRLVKTEFD